MEIVSLLAHPKPGSFCQALSERARERLEALGHRVVHHDLCAEGFDPVLRASEAQSSGTGVETAVAAGADPLVRTHRAEIARAEGLLVVHPNWWGKPPAVMAGWMDRVLVPGVAYRLRDSDGEPEGILKLRAALILNTSDTPAAREAAVFGDPLEAIWLRCVLPFCGATGARRQVFRPTVAASPETRAGWLDEAEALAGEVFGMAATSELPEPGDRAG